MFQPASRAKHTLKRQHRLISAAANAAVTVVASSANQPVAAAPRQQTGNEHLDGKLKVIGESYLLMCGMREFLEELLSIVEKHYRKIPVYALAMHVPAAPDFAHIQE